MMSVVIDSAVDLSGRALGVRLRVRLPGSDRPDVRGRDGLLTAAQAEAVMSDLWLWTCTATATDSVLMNDGGKFATDPALPAFPAIGPHRPFELHRGARHTDCACVVSRPFRGRD